MITISDLKNCPTDEAIMELIEAEREQYAGLVEAMKRLVSESKRCMSSITKSPYNDELIDRIKFAEEAVKPFIKKKLSDKLDDLAKGTGNWKRVEELADEARALENADTYELSSGMMKMCNRMPNEK